MLQSVKRSVWLVGAQPGSHWKRAPVFLLIVFLGMLVPDSSCAQGQEANDSAAEIAAPDKLILDEAKLLQEHPQASAKIVASLTRMRDEYGYPVYLALYYNLLDSSLRDRADQLYDAWIGDSGRGMVIVYQLNPVVYGDNPAMAYHKGDGLDSEYEAELAPIPQREITAILAKIGPKIKVESNKHHEALHVFIAALEGEIERYHRIEPTSWKDPENLTLIAVFSGFVIAIPLIGMFISRLLLAASNEAGKAYYFPDIEVACRLGAPYGGGWVSEKAFVPISARKPNVSPD